MISGIFGGCAIPVHDNYNRKKTTSVIATEVGFVDLIAMR